jgi:hypothetical protein
MILLVEAGTGPKLYQLKITLRGSRPSIWRRIVVRADMRLDRLHRVIYTSTGWTNSHLHQYLQGQAYYGDPGLEGGDCGDGMLPEKEYTLADLVTEAGEEFIYEYDFGDGWEHDVLVEKVLPPDAVFKHPVCLSGANACPPEDCGGIDGYHDFLEALADPEHEDHEQMKGWIGRKWDASRFDLGKTNTALKRLKV